MSAAIARLRAALVRTDQALRPPADPVDQAEAFVAIPIPRRAQWRLLRDPADVPEGYMVIGSMTVSRPGAATPEPSAPAALCPHCPLRRARGR